MQTNFLSAYFFAKKDDANTVQSVEASPFVVRKEIDFTIAMSNSYLTRFTIKLQEPIYADTYAGKNK